MGVVVVTGGASGLGEGCVRRFAEDGHKVWILDRNIALAEEVVRSLRANADALEVDVTSEQSLKDAAERIAAEDGPADHLVTSAGILQSAETVLDMDMAAHDELWNVNYRGTLLACRVFGRQMFDAGRGAIVTISSINGLVPFPLPAYSPSKTAITRLTQILAVELGRRMVRVNALAPTYVLTPAMQRRIDAGERDPKMIRSAGALDMFVTPDHIGAAAAFLCSDQAAAITGITLPVDAGYLAATPYRSYAGGVPWSEGD